MEETRCKDQGLQAGSPFFDACVFDLSATNDTKSVLQASADTAYSAVQEVNTVTANNRAYFSEYLIGTLCGRLS